MRLLLLREQIACGRPPDDLVVRHYYMYGVIGSPPGHVAADAVCNACVSGNRFPSRRVATAANAVVAGSGRGATRNVVGIVASCATQLSRAFQKTLGFAQPVSGVR